MDKETRNLVFNTTQAIRRLLEEEFSLQLEGTFDVHADGRIAGQPGSQLSAAERLVRCRIVEAIQHRLAVGESAAEAVRGFQSEAVFTFLNRLAALKMMEARALVLPCVSQSDQSQGFKEFSGLAPGLIELPDKGYRLYLECLFDEIGREVGVLFDRTDAASQLWPRRKALEAALAKLNTPELAGIWAEDETIGWIYQYYNDPEERRQMREESSAPRNSRELAVRNQFFTPRYVVEFLTDNTLGRIWYEMTKGQTRLKDQCRYLVRRPIEIFLTEGQASPTQPPAADNCSQEDLLRQPVHIPHRPLKDPREIRMIDPACGSMHFGLYAFDLFSVIYDEAWEMAYGLDAATKSAGTFTPFVAFVASFADKAAFLREVPRLIVEHNIHGIDIDPRAAQIAGLALWLRAQRGWQVLGLKSSDRPPIRRSNIVCAEPMPGERGLLREFVDRQFPQGERSLFQSFLENVWDKMRLAGEAGSLLKIEEEIRSAIEEARDAWQKLATRPPELFTTTELNQLSTAPELTGLEQAVSSLTPDPRHLTTDFWERIEERIYAALRDYAEQAENGGGFQRRLFAEDAARGFAFIDVCRKRYDVALMNPPFGQPVTSSKVYVAAKYKETWNDIYAMFLSRNKDLLSAAGFLGSITASTFLNLTKFESFRRILASEVQVDLLIELGSGVMDDAAVTAACTVFRNCKSNADTSTLFANLIRSSAHAADLMQLLGASGQFAELIRRRLIPMGVFGNLPFHILAYWMPEMVFKVFGANRKLGGEALVTLGLDTRGNEDRLYRLCWEPPISESFVDDWPIVTVGGNPQHFYRDCHMVVNWLSDSAELKVIASEAAGGTFTGRDYYFQSGLTYIFTGQTTFSVQPLSRGTVFAKAAHAIFPHKSFELLPFLGLLNSEPVRLLLKIINPNRFFQTAYVKQLPMPDLSVIGAGLSRRASLSLNEARLHARGDECSRLFLADWTAKQTGPGDSPFKSSISLAASRAKKLASWKTEIDELARSAYEIPIDEIRLLQDWIGESTAQELPGESEILDSGLPFVGSSLLGYLLGTAFGRWDIRYATGEQAAPELPDPFAPLPVCPPGQLQNAQGLPARPEDVPAAYPVRIPWDGILVDDPNHPLDIERRVREVIEIIWSGQAGGPTAEAIEHEACEILGVKSLRDYFRKPAGFFADHLKRYSKSRRQAPIYWPLSSPNGLYTVWLYYHRLTPDTLFTVLRDHVKPKLEYEERQAFQLRQEAGATPSTSQRRDIAEAEELVEDLRAFKAELDRVAPLFRPDLNDGVIINHAPLWRMIGLPKWRKDCQATWNELVKGDYDWAHLALHLWPERVIPKCATDRSLAIAHGLEAIFWREDPDKPGKWIARKVTDLELRGLIAERTSAAVKAAVEELRVSGQHQGSEGSGRVQRRGSASAGGARKRGKKASTQEEELL